MTITLGTIDMGAADSVRPSTYNPRQADDLRLGLVELSLRKLGWLLPIVATVDGEILSGHQRHYVATERMGATRLPVLFVDSMPLEKRKAINILFNRATNDMRKTDTSGGITAALLAQQESLNELAISIPDKQVDADEWYPVLYRNEMLPIRELIEINGDRMDSYAARVNTALLAEGVDIPLCVDEGGAIVNGIGRLESKAREQITDVACIVLTEQEAALARVLLNLLSMDFAIENRYADTLRFNSFRRARGVKRQLGHAFTFALFGTHKRAARVDLSNSCTGAEWKSFYGTTVLDFGAGLHQDTEILRGIGVDVIPFEPYRLRPGTDVIDKALAIAGVRSFLDRIASGIQFTSICQNSVMNSVPFEGDRKKIVQIIASLCGPSTTVYTCAVSTASPRYQSPSGQRVYVNQSLENLSFLLDYERHTILSDFTDKPKVQKFHTPREWYDLWRTGFDWVQVDEGNELVVATCRAARSIAVADLANAIELEFDLPYPDGTRMGLVGEAKAAFSKRLGVTIK